MIRAVARSAGCKFCLTALQGTWTCTTRQVAVSAWSLTSTRDVVSGPVKPSLLDPEQKKGLVRELLAAKEASGKTFTQIAQEIGLTNAYTAQLFYNQAELHEGTVEKLRAAVPGLNDGLLEEMRKAPFRSFDSDIAKEPHVYRMTEAVMHYGQALKAILNEECGDGIMSAIDLYASARTVTGANEEKRFVITFNGKFLPYNEQVASEDTSQGRPKACRAPKQSKSAK